MRPLFVEASLLCAAALAAQDNTLHFAKQREMPLGAPGSFDYLSVDTAARRLLIAHGTRIDVLDLDKGEKAGMVEGLQGAHGALIVPELQLGFATSGRDNMLVVFDPATFKISKKIPTGDGPDALLYVTTAKEVWTMNHRAGTVTCVDAKSLEPTATIEFGGQLEFAVEWADKGRVFVNSEDKGFIGELDTGKHTLVRKHELAPARTPTGLALDAKNGILFCGCDKQLAIMDAATGKVLATPAIGRGCDAVAFDADKGLVFASCGDGTTTVLRAVDARTFAVAGTIDTAAGARTCTLDPHTHMLYVGAGTRGKDDVRVLEFAAQAKAEAKPPEAGK